MTNPSQLSLISLAPPFMILLTLAMGKNLSCSRVEKSLLALLLLFGPPELLSELAFGSQKLFALWVSLSFTN
jgi:hypothetical protein